MDEIKKLAIEAALQMQNHGNVDQLIKSAKIIEDYLRGKDS